MAENYDKTLELFKTLQQNGGVDNIAPRESAPNRKKKQMMVGSVSDLNEAVFGKYNMENEPQKYDGQKILMETMKEYQNGNVSKENRERVENNIRNSKLPKEILQSMISQPLIETNVNGDDIDTYMEKIVKQNSNIEASKRINRLLEEGNEPTTKQANNNPQPTMPTAAIDYSKIESIINEAIDRKLSQFRQLNESSQQKMSSIKAIQEVDGSKFLIADTSDNVYECTLIYKGKNNRKK